MSKNAPVITVTITNEATVEELFEAFISLSDSDLQSLRKAASLRLEGTQFTEPADLLHEALARCLDGRRRWPKEVPFPVFIFHAMKSISSADRQLHSSKLVLQASQLETELWRDPLGSLGEMAPSAEEDFMRLEAIRLSIGFLDDLSAEFHDDPHVAAIMAGWPKGYGSEDVIESAGMTFKQYDSARKRIERSESVKRMRIRWAT
jgi:hypothetical protein